MESYEIKHKRMSSIHSTENRLETKFMKALWHKGIRYRKNIKVLSCRPDIVITKYKIAIFCDGDFWHGHYQDGSQTKVNTKFWIDKIARNKERDLENDITLRDAGWTVLRFWESDIKANLDSCITEVLVSIISKNQH